MNCQRFSGMRNKGGTPVLVMGRHVQMYVMLRVFASSEFEPFRNRSESFSVFNNTQRENLNNQTKHKKTLFQEFNNLLQSVRYAISVEPLPDIFLIMTVSTFLFSLFSLKQLQ